MSKFITRRLFHKIYDSESWHTRTNLRGGSFNDNDMNFVLFYLFTL